MMTLEELIRYAINGITLDDNLTQKDLARKISPLIDILIDFSDDTYKDLQSILSDRRNPYQDKS